MTNFTPFSTRKLIIGLSLQGWKQKQISQVTGVHHNTVGRIFRYFKSTGEIYKKSLAQNAYEKFLMPKYTPFSTRKEVIDLFLEGRNHVQISQITGVHRVTVSRIVGRFESTGEIAYKKPPGRPHEKDQIDAPYRHTPFFMRKEVNDILTKS